MNRLLIFCSAFLLFTCGKREPSTEIIKVDPAFTGYISAFTSGVISNEGKVKIHFRESVPGAVAGEELSEGIFEVIPETKGKAYWVSDRIAEFSPDDILPSGKLFEVSFKLGEVIEVPEKLEVLTFQFQTKPQYINVSFEGLEAYNKTDLSWQRLKGQLTTSDFAYEEEVEKVLKVTQAGSAMRLNWEHAANGRTHNFVVDSISRGKTASRVILEWDGEKLLSESKAEEVIDIPPLGDFRVMDISVTQQPEQYITLFFSDPLNESQDLDGLVYLKSGTLLRLVVDDYTIKAYPSSRLTEKTQIAVAEGVRNSAGYQLKEAFLRDVKFSNQKPSVELVGDGVILPSTDGLIFPFKAVNLSAVNVKIIKVFEDNVAQFLQTNQMDGSSQMRRVGRLVYKDEVELKSMGNVDLGAWNTFALDISDLISVSSGSIYRISLSFDQSQSLYPCGESISDSEDEIDFMLEDPEIARYDGPSDYYYDDYDDYYYYYEDGYNYQERENPCARSYYMRNRRTVTRNVLASDLGIIAKSGKDKTLTVAVTDLKSTESLEGVALEVRNYQNQLIATGITDGEGMANIPIKNKPFLLVARQGSQVGYLRLDDGSSLSLSMFDVNGSEVKRGLKGYLYGERGVWRPGDSLYVSFMMEDKLNLVPDDHPIVFELYTPENQLFERKVRTSAIKGLYDFRTATKMESPTGNWLAKVKVGGASFTKTLKIETVKPNRLKINIDFNDPILKSGKPSTGDLSLKWLHGAIARNLKADVEVTLQEGNQPFEDYKEYTFNDPTKRFDAQTKFIFDGKVNDQGTAQVSAKFSVQGNAPGLLDANFKVRAFEEGGDFSVDRFKMPYSPYSSYVGLKIPKGKGWNDALYSNEPNLLPVVTLDEDGNPVRRDQLKIEVYQIGWRWWWERNEREDLASYIRSSSSNLMKTDYVSTGSDGKATYELNFGQNTWGRKLILITDPVSGHRTGKLFYTTYRGWWSSGQGGPGGAEMLTFKTDKTKYAVGDKVQVTLPKNEEGRALVSLESGSGVIDAFWVQANADNQGMFEFETTPEMAPNAYVHIAYIQPHKVTSNDLPIRMYGVQSITIENPETHLTPVIDMPDVLEPEKNFTVKVEEKDGKGMAYTVAVVDDGLLDLTRFKTPNPWNYFYSREALGVKTWDMYKYVVGAVAGEMSGLLALGGDEELGGGKDGQKANRFKPVVQYAGPFYLEPGDVAEHTFSMPNYVGSVRTMIVAGGGEAYGKAEKTTPVKKPLMVLTTLPRVMGPGETVRVPVTVFAMDKKIRNVKAQIEANELFDVVGSGTQSVRFSEEGDKVIYFELKAKDKIGVGKVEVAVSGHGERANNEVEMNVRLANPPLTTFVDAAIEPGDTWVGTYEALGVQGTNDATLELSSLPPLNLEDRIRYLIRYPHGCIEQTTSAAFPQLHLDKVLDLDEKQKSNVENNIRGAIERIRDFQLNDGGLSYWPNSYSNYSQWGTNYAGHFMLEAEAEGYTLPIGYKKNWIRFQTSMANQWSNTSGSYQHWYRSNQLTQAYRLYTLALAGKPAIGAMNRLKAVSNLSTAARWRLAAAYQLAGRSAVAKQIVANIPLTIKEYRELSYTYGSTLRDQAMILEALVLMDQKTRAKTILDDLVEALGSRRWYSTQTTAYSLLAIAKFMGEGEGEPFSYSYTINGNRVAQNTPEKPIVQHELVFDEDNKVSVTNKGSKTLFARITSTGVPLTSDQVDQENDLLMQVNYLTMNGGSLDVTKLDQGTDFMAEVTVRHPGTRSWYDEMALTQIFPSGWEIRNLRMDLNTAISVGDQPEYQDIRDDRVLTYFDLRSTKSKTYRVVLNAAYLGKYYLPSVHCGAMYDEDISAYKAGRWVEVVQAGGE